MAAKIAKPSLLEVLRQRKQDGASMSVVQDISPPFPIAPHPISDAIVPVLNSTRTTSPPIVAPARSISNDRHVNAFSATSVVAALVGNPALTQSMKPASTAELLQKHRSIRAPPPHLTEADPTAVAAALSAAMVAASLQPSRANAIARAKQAAKRRSASSSLRGSRQSSTLNLFAAIVGDQSVSSENKPEGNSTESTAAPAKPVAKPAKTDQTKATAAKKVLPEKTNPPRKVAERPTTAAPKLQKPAVATASTRPSTAPAKKAPAVTTKPTRPSEPKVEAQPAVKPAAEPVQPAHTEVQTTSPRTERRSVSTVATSPMPLSPATRQSSTVVSPKRPATEKRSKSNSDPKAVATASTDSAAPAVPSSQSEVDVPKSVAPKVNPSSALIDDALSYFKQSAPSYVASVEAATEKLRLEAEVQQSENEFEFNDFSDTIGESIQSPPLHSTASETVSSFIDSLPLFSSYSSTIFTKTQPPPTADVDVTASASNPWTYDSNSNRTQFMSPTLAAFLDNAVSHIQEPSEAISASRPVFETAPAPVKAISVKSSASKIPAAKQSSSIASIEPSSRGKSASKVPQSTAAVSQPAKQSPAAVKQSSTFPIHDDIRPVVDSEPLELEDGDDDMKERLKRLRNLQVQWQQSSIEQQMELAAQQRAWQLMQFEMQQTQLLWQQQQSQAQYQQYQQYPQYPNQQDALTGLAVSNAFEVANQRIEQIASGPWLQALQQSQAQLADLEAEMRRVEESAAAHEAVVQERLRQRSEAMRALQAAQADHERQAAEQEWVVWQENQERIQAREQAEAQRVARHQLYLAQLQQQQAQQQSALEEQRRDVEEQKRQHSIMLQQYNEQQMAIYQQKQNKLLEKCKVKIREVFDQLDADKSGSISLKELEGAMRARGLDPTAADIQEQIAAIDKDRSGKIDYSEFEAQMLSIVTAQVVAAEKQAAKDAFQQKLKAVYEKLVAHKSGKFDSKSLDEELKAQSIDASATDVRKVISSLDQKAFSSVTLDAFVSKFLPAVLAQRDDAVPPLPIPTFVVPPAVSNAVQEARVTSMRDRLLDLQRERILVDAKLDRPSSEECEEMKSQLGGQISESIYHRVRLTAEAVARDLDRRGIAKQVASVEAQSLKESQTTVAATAAVAVGKKSATKPSVSTAAKPVAGAKAVTMTGSAPDSDTVATKVISATVTPAAATAVSTQMSAKVVTSRPDVLRGLYSKLPTSTPIQSTAPVAAAPISQATTKVPSPITKLPAPTAQPTPIAVAAPVPVANVPPQTLSAPAPVVPVQQFQATWDLVPPSVVANQTTPVAPAAAPASSVLEPVPASQVLKMSFQQAMASNVSPVTALPSIQSTSSNVLEIPTQRPPIAQPMSAAEVQQRLHQIPARAGPEQPPVVSQFIGSACNQLANPTSDPLYARIFDAASGAGLPQSGLLAGSSEADIQARAAVAMQHYQQSLSKPNAQGSWMDSVSANVAQALIEQRDRSAASSTDPNTLRSMAADLVMKELARQPTQVRQPQWPTAQPSERASLSDAALLQIVMSALVPQPPAVQPFPATSASSPSSNASIIELRSEIDRLKAAQVQAQHDVLAIRNETDRKLEEQRRVMEAEARARDQQQVVARAAEKADNAQPAAVVLPVTQTIDAGSQSVVAATSVVVSETTAPEPIKTDVIAQAVSALIISQSASSNSQASDALPKSDGTQQNSSSTAVDAPVAVSIAEVPKPSSTDKVILEGTKDSVSPIVTVSPVEAVDITARAPAASSSTHDASSAMVESSKVSGPAPNVLQKTEANVPVKLADPVPVVVTAAASSVVPSSAEPTPAVKIETVSTSGVSDKKDVVGSTIPMVNPEVSVVAAKDSASSTLKPSAASSANIAKPDAVVNSVQEPSASKTAIDSDALARLEAIQARMEALSRFHWEALQAEARAAHAAQQRQEAVLQSLQVAAERAAVGAHVATVVNPKSTDMPPAAIKQTVTKATSPARKPAVNVADSSLDADIDSANSSLEDSSFSSDGGVRDSVSSSATVDVAASHQRRLQAALRRNKDAARVSIVANNNDLSEGEVSFGSASEGEVTFLSATTASVDASMRRSAQSTLSISPVPLPRAERRQQRARSISPGFVDSSVVTLSTDSRK